MRVAIGLTTLRPGRVGGVETYVRGLLGALGTQSDDEIHVLADARVRDAYRDLARGGVTFHVLRDGRGRVAASKPVSFLLSAAQPPRRLRALLGPTDVVHYPIAVPVPRVTARRIVSLHDVRHRDSPEDFSRAQRMYRAVAYDEAARRADAVITVSADARQRLIDALGLDPSRVHAVHHGIDHTVFRPGEDDEDRVLLRQYGLPERYLFYPANLWKHKNHRTLIAALGLLDDRDLTLVLTGQEYGAGDELRRQVEAAGLGARVRHLGYVPRNVLPALYRRSLGLIFPSRYEGFGAPPLEAMACGTPVAAGRTTAVTEVCGDAAILFDPEDETAMAAAMTRLSSDDAQRVELVERGRVRAGQFTWPAAARRHLEIYRLTSHAA